MTAPHPESAKAAVEALRAELDIVDRALDANDRKAALLPAALGAIAGIVIAPDMTFTADQQVLLVLALLLGTIASIVALVVLQARYLNLGPNAERVVNGTHFEPADFNQAVAASLAKSVAALSVLSTFKARWLNVAMGLAAATILLLALARVAGGSGVTDAQTPSTAPASEAPATPQAPQQSTTQTTPAEATPPPPDFGQQIAAKGGLPPDLARRINEIEKKS